MTTTTSSHLYELTYALMVRLSEDDVTTHLTQDQQLLLAEAFEALTDSGADTVEALFALAPPAGTEHGPRELLNRTVKALQQIVADTSDLNAALRFTRALDLTRAAAEITPAL